MLVLLDTHVLLCAVADPDKLSPAARAAIEDPETELLVSAASAWEIAAKHRIGKLPEARALMVGYSAHLTRLGAREVPVTSEHALEAGKLTWRHRDPFDRMIVVQSIVESAALASADSVFADVVGVRLVW